MTDARLGRIVAQKINSKLKAAAELAWLKRIWEGSPKYGKGALLEAFRLCMDKDLPLPPWLARAVHAELMRPTSKQVLKHYQRWREVRRMTGLPTTTNRLVDFRVAMSLPNCDELS